MQTSAQFKGGFMERPLGRFRPKVELVSGGSALEAAQGMLDEIGGKNFAKVDGRHALLLTRTEKRNP
ncbi:MAG: hypothetical protein U0793_27540 [Gemmataceae bacterium]